MISITLINKKVNTKTNIITLSCLVLLAAAGLWSRPVRAANFNEGAYGVCAYQQTGSGCAGSGELADTGQPTQLIAGVAALCIGSGGLILSLRRSRRRRQIYQNNHF